MALVKNLFKKANEIVCGSDGYLLGSCKQSVGYDKSYIHLVAGALLFNYALPSIFIVVIIPAIIGNVLAFDIIEFFRLFNPFFVIAYIPLFAVDGILVSIMLITMAAITIIYWMLYFRELGIFSIVPMGAWLLGIFLWFVPVVGPIIAVCLSAFPFMLVSIALHWYTYR